MATMAEKRDYYEVLGVACNAWAICWSVSLSKTRSPHAPH